MADFKETVKKLFDSVDVQIDGARPWDPKIHNELFYARVISGGSLGLGESYMDGWWDCDSLDQFSDKLLTGRIDKQVKATNLAFLGHFIKAYLFNAQTKKRAYIVGREHYDTGNDLFSLMLDKRMNYSCGYWRGTDSLEQAQVNKLDLVCRKLHLKPGMDVLEIGCGWGSFAKYASQNYDVNVHGVTVSKEQMHYAERSCKGLNTSFELKDYRELSKKYDAIVSIGMFEHVGSKNYKTFMNVVHSCLKEDGMFLLHTIGRNNSTHARPSCPSQEPSYQPHHGYCFRPFRAACRVRSGAANIAAQPQRFGGISWGSNRASRWPRAVYQGCRFAG